MAFFDLQPFGQDHTDFLLAQLTTELANRWRGKGEKSYSPKDFLPFERNKPASPEFVKAKLRSILGGNRRKS